jgi:hypothetical protein
MADKYRWHRRFALLPHRMEDGRLAWLCWIEVRTVYMNPYLEELRWPAA